MYQKLSIASVIISCLGAVFVLTGFCTGKTKEILLPAMAATILGSSIRIWISVRRNRSNPTH
jgi:hypothetical protein